MNSTLSKQKVYKNIGVALTSVFGFLTLFGVVSSATMVGGMQLFLGSMILFAPPLAVGIYMIKSSVKKIRIIQTDEKENLVLNLASKNRGILTQANLAKSTKLTLSESGLILNEMTTKGIAQVEVNDNGVIEYHFNSLKKY
jgi:hypothetical protein